MTDQQSVISHQLILPDCHICRYPRSNNRTTSLSGLVKSEVVIDALVGIHKFPVDKLIKIVQCINTSQHY